MVSLMCCGLQMNHPNGLASKLRLASFPAWTNLFKSQRGTISLFGFFVATCECLVKDMLWRGL